MMRFCLLISGMLFFLCGVHCSMAQRITYSQTKRISPRTTFFNIIGRNQAGVWVRHVNKEGNSIDIYDKQSLSISKSKSILNQYAPTSMVKTVLLRPTDAVIFFIKAQTDDSASLYAQFISSNLKETASKHLYTFSQNVQTVYDSLRYTVSDNKKDILFYWQKDKDIHALWTSTDADTSHIRSYTMKESLDIQAVKLSLEKKAFILCKQSEMYRVLTLEPYVDNLESHKLESKYRIINNPFLIVHPQGSAHVVALYEDQQTFKNGLCVLDCKKMNQNQYIDFNQALSRSLTQAREQNKDILYSLKIKDVVAQKKASYAVVLESDFITQRERIFQTSSIYTPFGDRTEKVNQYHFNDLIVLSLDAKNGALWTRVLTKNQVTENDYGIFSSYAMHNDKEKLYFHFTEDIYGAALLNQYALKGDNTFDEVLLINQQSRNIALIPSFSKQISPRDLVIPSIKKNIFQLVQISY